MRVIVIGPNLRDQSQGSFHAHAEGCADIERNSLYRRHERELVEADTRLAVAEWIYPRGEFEWTREADYVDDIHFAPCLSELAGR